MNQKGAEGLAAASELPARWHRHSYHSPCQAKSLLTPNYHCVVLKYFIFSI